MKKIMIALLFVMVIAAYAQNMETYCCAPPFVMTVVKPNILFVLDMTGSMWWRAARFVNNGYYTPNLNYYGYFDDSVSYYYRNNVFFPDGHQPPGSSGPFPGNIMNWAVMSRVDILRKVLSGGKGNPPPSWPKHTLTAEGQSSYWPCDLAINVGGTIYKYRFTKPIKTTIGIERYYGNVSSPDTVVLSDTLPLGHFSADVDIPPGHPAGMGGVLRQICDKDYDGNFDADAPRVALIFFSTTNTNFELTREFYHSDGASAVSAEAYMTAINSKDPGGGTPVGKAIFNSICYLSYVDIPANYHLGKYICHGRGTKYDPYYTGQGASLQPVWCRKSFVILLGDGESNSDSPAINTHAPLPNGPFARPLYDYDNDNHPGDNGSTHPADDYAYYAHITDLRPDQFDKNNIEFYSIFAFGQGAPLFQEIAKDGGFNDKNGDNIPQLEEYDEDGDGVPDNYFAASEGSELEAAIIKIIQDILAKVSSSSGVSVVTTGTKSAGTTVQAQFYPRRNFPTTGETLEWIGTCHSLWLDPYGWLREDTEYDAHLHLQNDYVVTLQWESGPANVMVTREQDVNGNGVDSEFVFIEKVPIEELEPVWDAGNWLYAHSVNDRNVMTFVDGNGNGLVDAGEIWSFIPGNAATFQPHLGVATLGEADTVVRYVLGTDFPNYRSRTAALNVWKLGDIINGGAVAVQSAIERYDFIYGDQSYIEYYDQYKDRRQVIYVGGNDGMLHCFNGGIAVEMTADPMVPMRYDPAGFDLGEELWAYIPFNLLPHLKWLQHPKYCHVYYNDLKAYVTDAQIFVNDAVHPQNWGTLLIGGMRLGGMQITTGGHDYTSAYFAIDVTDPLNPVPMWEFTDPDLALTVCYSTVAKVESDWYLIFGSGPKLCGGESDQRAYIYVLDLTTGQLLRKWQLPDDEAFITNIFGADWGMDYNVDRIYLGTCYYDNTLPQDWGGKIYRILTNDNTDPANWDTATVFDMERPITAEGSVATDDYNHLWLYFGSGRFFSEADEIDYTVQRYIGIREDTTRATAVAGLYDVTDIELDTNGVVHTGAGVTTFDALIDTINTIGGWYRDLEALGERSLSTTLVFGGAVLFTAFTPTGDICSYGGTGSLYALFYRTGTASPDEFLIPGDTLFRPIWVDIGQGMPSEPALYVTADQTKVFIQAGGGIVSPETGIPGLPESGVIIWKGR